MARSLCCGSIHHPLEDGGCPDSAYMWDEFGGCVCDCHASDYADQDPDEHDDDEHDDEHDNNQGDTTP
jgi:hypothetical protein